MSGNPFSQCEPIRDEPKVQQNPCLPSPCGLYSECRVVGDRPTCSCLPRMVGNPPYCKPECSVSQECNPNQACVNQRCIEPCQGACGYEARCEVVNHSPIWLENLITFVLSKSLIISINNQLLSIWLFWRSFPTVLWSWSNSHSRWNSEKSLFTHTLWTKQYL